MNILTFWHASDRWVSEVVVPANASDHVMRAPAQGILAAQIAQRAWISALHVDASLVAAAVRVGSALWTTSAVRITQELR